MSEGHQAGARRPLPDLDQLRLLVGIAEHASLGAAARSIGMAQPNASRAIAHLERQLGLSLVDRSPAGSRLTTEGTVVVQWARDVLDAAERLMLGVDALRTRQLGHLELSASKTVAEYLVPRWLGEFRRRQPDVQVNLEVHNSHEVMERVLGGRAELGFVETPSLAAGLSAAVVGRDRLRVVVSPAHPWARRRKPVPVAELAATPLIVREPGSGTRITLEHLLGDHPLAPPALELASNAAVTIAAAAGVAPAVLSDLAVAAAVDSGELRAVAIEGVRLDRVLHGVWRGQLTLRGHALEFLEIARGGRARRRGGESLRRG